MGGDPHQPSWTEDSRCHNSWSRGGEVTRYSDARDSARALWRVRMSTTLFTYRPVCQLAPPVMTERASTMMLNEVLLAAQSRAGW